MNPKSVWMTRDELLKWVRQVAFELGFVILILRSDTTKQPRRKTFVILGYERDGKYTQYKKDAKTITRTRKCDCPFRLKERSLVKDGYLGLCVGLISMMLLRHWSTIHMLVD